ncbi:response regulator transcription factor [Paenibacillus sp. YN15]|uniref:response regulator transcription factor n=1 Tax=Paenibacillus sp. YN15 TaxID=1742774 RepID=UPI000DCD28DC|nr:response regulator transcription factor [Paenibacillus sp. YN15]RAU96122.1 DNA-binding response regulator [Paenibacillus sp. YN15]
MERIRLLLVEDDEDWLRGLEAYLSREPDFTVAATASSRETAEQAVREAAFDVALVDIMMHGAAEGIDLAQLICQTTPARVVMLTSLQEKEMIFDAYRVGAIDYMVKSDFGGIPAAVRAAYARESPMNAYVAAQMREEFRRLRQLEQAYRIKELRDKITPSELQVLRMIDAGHTQSDIADKLYLSLRTIKVHVGNILKKLGGSTSKEAARQARELGLFEEEKQG